MLPCRAGLVRDEGQGMGGGGLDGSGGERKLVGGVVQPCGELVHVPRADGVSGLAEDEVEGGVVEVGEVCGEALGGAEGTADLLDGGGVSADGMGCGAGGDADDAADERGDGEDGVFDVDGVDFAVGPLGEIGWSVGFVEGFIYGGGEEVVPVGIGVGEPAGGGVDDDLLFGVGHLMPVVELPGGAEFGDEDHGPELDSCDVYDGWRGAAGVYATFPVAEDVCGLVETFGVGGEVWAGVVDGIGEALGDEVIDVGVDVGLELEHVGRGEVLGGCEDLPDALVAIGIGPVEGDGVGVAFGGDSVVGGGEDSVGRVEDAGELVEGDVAGPGLCGVDTADGDGAERAGCDDAAAEGDLADRVVADVTLVIGVDDILGGASPVGEGSAEGGPVVCAVDGEERGVEVG